jgi:hypothetical protein
MKKIILSFSIIAIAAITVYSCKKKSSDPETTTPSTPAATSSLATLSSSGIFSITYNTAISGGNITADGADAVTSRGVCWALSTNPLVTGNHTGNGSGIGTFTSNITGLLPSTVYYVRSYATNGVGTAYGNQLSFSTPAAPTSTFVGIVGGTYQGGIIAYILTSADPGYSSTFQHGLIVSPSDILVTPWGCEGTLMAGSDGTAIGTGYQNTVDIMAGCSTPTNAATKCAALTLGGYNDWFLPSKDELNKIYINRIALGITGNNYWSSTEGNLNQAWSHNFSFNTQGVQYKSSLINVRAMRMY